MTKHRTKLNVRNVGEYLEQITKNTSNDTIIKFKSRAANFYKKAGGIKNMRKALYLYNEAHDLQCKIRGELHPRSYDILRKISECDKLLIKLVENNKKKD